MRPKIAFLSSWRPDDTGFAVTMATSDKHSQTSAVNGEESATLKFCTRGMYDETVPVVNSREIDSPTSDEEVLRATMSKFNPPARHIARHDFDSESDSDTDAGNFLNTSGDDQSPTRDLKLEAAPVPQKPVQKESKTGNTGRSKATLKREDSSNSETDSGEMEQQQQAGIVAASERRRAAGLVIPAEGAYDPKQFQDLKVPPEIENIFQYIMKYTPQKIDIEFKLQPFVPEYVPAVGDIDAFLKVTTPARDVRANTLNERVLEHVDNLGLTILDEPAAEQSDSALLHLQLRAISKTASSKSTVLTKKIEDVEKNPKAIDRWIKDVSELHLTKPAPTVTYTEKMPDIDSLMEEWPEPVEEALNELGFPPADLDCTLSQYLELVCALFDIPIHGDSLNHRIQAVHLLFSLYSAVKNSQLYKERIDANL